MFLQRLDPEESAYSLAEFLPSKRLSQSLDTEQP